MALATVHVTIRVGTTETEIVEFLQAKVGRLVGSRFHFTRKRALHCENLGYGTLQFEKREDAERACELSAENSLILKTTNLIVNPARFELKRLPSHALCKWMKGRFIGGCLVSPTRFKGLWKPAVNIVTELDFEWKLLRFWFVLAEDAMEYKMEFPFKDDLKIIPVVGEDKQSRSFLLKPGFTPRVYMRRLRSPVNTGIADLDEVIKLGQASNLNIFNVQDIEDPWTRTGDFQPHRPLSQCFQFVLEVSEVTDEDYKNAIKNLGDYNVVAAPLNENTPASENERRLHLVVEEHDYYASPELVTPVLNSPYYDRLPFDIQWKLGGLVQAGKLPGPCLTDRFLCKLNPSYQFPPDWTLQALHDMQMQQGTVYEPEKFLSAVYNRINREGRVDYLLRPEKGYVWVRRMLVTPTKVIFLGPELECSNRVTRMYQRYIDYFTRVTFVEEDLTELQASALARPTIRSVVPGVMRPEPTPVDERMRAIRYGFWIGDRRFEPLAFSASQLRENSMWMFASPHLEINADSLMRTMGNFSHIRNVAKCAARRGQCFSSSTPTFDVPFDQAQEIHDISNGTDHNFSDGIGMISPDFAKVVAEKLLKGGAVPSAFQIRYGGFKGVVAVEPKCKDTLCLRPSMRKFDSPHCGFEVLNASRAQACYLNRQIILLLSTLGIGDSVFERMQDDVVQHLDKMFYDKDVALKVLEVCPSGDNATDAIRAMLKMGYDPAVEPHLTSYLHVFRADEVVNLRNKARILVPKGRVLIGCLDESRTLKDDEVFVQVSPLGLSGGHLSDNSKLTPVYEHNGTIAAYVVTGDVVITRNPCLHPGDVRVLRAVDVPQLRHKRDCLVFTQVGKRPHPNMCSGGDLDGDIYFCSWDPRLIPSKTDPPMDYTPPPEKLLECAPTKEDMIEFHADSAMNQNLGAISNAHLVMADKSAMRARDPKCLELAKLASMAVDFAKTGVPAILHSSLRPTEYPDFMEKEHTHKVYRSEGILGKLYRRLQSPDLIPGVDSPTREALRLSFDQALIVEGYEDYLEIAEIHKNWYDKKLMGLMNQYGIERECEICSGRILMLSPAYRRRGDQKERIAMAMKALTKEVMTYFHQDLTSDRHEKEVHAKVSAYYYVTYHPDYFCKSSVVQGTSEQSLGQNVSAKGSNIHLLSFAWHFWDRLKEIKNSRGACMRAG